MTSLKTALGERPTRSANAKLWAFFARLAAAEEGRALDTHHRFAPDDTLVIDRSTSVPRADSRLVHYDPRTCDYIIASADRLRWCTRDGVTVFPETSPWDAQIRQDPPVNFHAIVETPARGGWARGWRGPFLYPITEGLRAATVRDLVVLAPSGLVHYLKELRLPDREPGAVAEVHLAMRVALASDELLLTFAGANVGDRPLRVSLISFLLPLLTRGMVFNAESAWFHEGWAVADSGLLIRSSEEGTACGIRRTVDASVEHWHNLNALAYYGGIGRNAASPAALEPDAFDAQAHAGFVAPACAHHHHRRVLAPGEDFAVSLALKTHDGVAAALAYLAAPLTAAEVEQKVAATAEAGRALTSSTRLTVGSPFSSYYEWTKQQVSGCARIRPYFRLFHNYLLGVRDKAQAAYAAIDFDPAVARRLILELSGEQFEDGRFPRQYSLDGHYDLRYFMDSGLWLPTLLVPHYLAATGDFAVLFEEIGYQRLLDWNLEAKTGRVVASRKRSTVLAHLVENVEHVLRQRDAKTGLVAIRDGDWNDAIGLIRSSTMVLEQLYWALGELMALYDHLPERWRDHPAVRRLRPARYRRLRDELHATFERRCVQRDDDGRLRILHGYTHEGRTVGGFHDADGVAEEGTVRRALGPGYRRWAEPFRARDGRTLYKLRRRFVDLDDRKAARLPPAVRALFLVDRVSSTPLSFAILSGIVRHETADPARAAALEASIVRDTAALDSPRGWRTFSVPFNRCSRELGIGRIGDLDGAENASPYIHAGLFLGQALYQIGREREAAAFLDKTVPLDRTLHAGQNRSIQYLPNSWGIGRNNDGASMNDFHTNAASILSRIVVEHVAGLRPTYEGLLVQPTAHVPQVVRCGDEPIEYRATLRRRPIRVIHEWTSAVAARAIWLGTRALRLGEAGPRGVRTAFIPWGELSSRQENTLVVRDPIEEVP
jgi:hypothetical protein